MHHVFALIAFLVIAFTVRAEDACTREYDRGKQEMGAWAEMFGIVEGVIYGHSLTLEPGAACLAGMPKEKVQSIAKALMSESFSKTPILMDDVPTKEQATEFLKRFFPCASNGS